MRQDREHSKERCIGKINAFWRRQGVSVEAHVGRNGEIQSRLTNGLPPVRLDQSQLARATRASGVFKERAQ